MEQGAAHPVIQDDAIEVKCYLEEFARAIRGGDLAEIMAFYAADVLAFDMIPPLEVRGADEYARIWDQCFTRYFKFPVEFEFHELEIAVCGDIAITHGLVRTSGVSLRDGKTMQSWIRNTTGLRREDGKWKIIHEHNSVPIDAQTGKPLMNLRPRRLYS